MQYLSHRMRRLVGADLAAHPCHVIPGTFRVTATVVSAVESLCSAT